MERKTGEKNIPKKGEILEFFKEREKENWDYIIMC